MKLVTFCQHSGHMTHPATCHSAGSQSAFSRRCVVSQLSHTISTYSGIKFSLQVHWCPRRDLNPQPPVLETGCAAIALRRHVYLLAANLATDIFHVIDKILETDLSLRG